MDKSKDGPLWHLTVTELIIYMKCHNIPIPVTGSGKNKMVLKRDYIEIINKYM